MKSLAHPEWPYEGTPWEWRGFAASPTRKEIKAALDQLDAERCAPTTEYQRLNFGPDLP